VPCYNGRGWHGKAVAIEGLDKLLSRGYDWLKDYFVAHPEALENLAVCQNRFKSIEADRNLNIASLNDS
jgi:hypothetical protein